MYIHSGFSTSYCIYLDKNSLGEKYRHSITGFYEVNMTKHKQGSNIHVSVETIAVYFTTNNNVVMPRT